MRGIAHLADRYYIVSSDLTLDPATDCYVAGLPFGGTVSIPRGGLVAFEAYPDEQIQAFRDRAAVVDAEYKARTGQKR
jgi:hypothetical protein